MLTYAAFIEEVRVLLATARSLFHVPGRRQSEKFRRWHHELKDLISRIERQKYKIACSIEHRTFDLGDENNPLLAQRAESPIFTSDLQDTIVELETLIARFEKFGDPGAVSTGASTPSGLAVPDRVTLAWLWQHVPLSVWSVAGSVVVAAFASGFAAGHSQLAAEYLDKLNPPPPAASSPALATNPPRKSGLTWLCS